MNNPLRFLDDPRFRPLSRAQRAAQRAVTLNGPRMGNRDEVRAYLAYLDNPRYRPAPASRPVSIGLAPEKQPLPSASSIDGALEDPALTPAMRDTLRLAQTRHPDLWALDNGMLFRRHVQQLLPLRREMLMDWGAASLQAVADLTNELAMLTRAHVDLRGLDVLQKLLDDLRRPQTLWERMTRNETTFTTTHAHLGLLRAQVKPLLDRCDGLDKDAKAAGQRLAVLLASMSLVASTAAGADGKLLQALDERNNLLHQSLRQATLLPPQIQALGAQMTDLTARVDEALNVTLPAIELARASHLAPSR